MIPEEILRYLGIRREMLSEQIEKTIYEVTDEITSACRPKHIIRETESIEIFSSKDLEKHLSGCEKYFLFAVTLGAEADRILLKYSKTDILKAAAAQAVASWYIEEYADNVMDSFDTKNLYFRPRFSPGYGDFTLENQKLILSILGADKALGITLTDGLMMVPEKSVTAVLGLAPSECSKKSKCTQCKNYNCPYRRD